MDDRLPRHVTGFFDRGEVVCSFSSAGFKQACYAVASMESGSVEQFEADRVGQSYYRATITTAVERIVVLCNAFHPLLGFRSPETVGSRSGTGTFFEPTHLAALFSAVTPLRVLNAGWLHSEVHERALIDLAEAELRQIRYWKPSRIGDIVFNNWD